MTEQIKANAAQVISAHAHLFSTPHLKTIDMLLSCDQYQLFLDWDPLGIADDAKLALLEEIAQIHQICPVDKYTERSRAIIKRYLDGVNTFSDYIAFPPTPPEFSTIRCTDELKRVNHPAHPRPNHSSFRQSQAPAISRLESIGRAYTPHLGFVLVAGGIGERLGFNDIKVSLATNLITRTPFLQHYCEWIKGIQENFIQTPSSITTATPLALPFVIMTSPETHHRTLQLLEDNDYYGLLRSQVFLLQQQEVPAIIDTLGNLAMTRTVDSQTNVIRYKLITKPHGHGDIHQLLLSHPNSPLQSGYFKTANTQFLFFFQDTNALSFNTIFCLLGKAIEQSSDMVTLGLHRYPGDALGGIAKLVSRTAIQNATSNLCLTQQTAAGKPNAPMNEGKYKTSTAGVSSYEDVECKYDRHIRSDVHQVPSTEASRTVHRNRNTLHDQTRPDALTINVEYNIFHQLVQNEPLQNLDQEIISLPPADKVNPRLTNLVRSPTRKPINTMPVHTRPIHNQICLYPGNSNIFIVRLSSYIDALHVSQGTIGEFVNPKFQKGDGMDLTSTQTMQEKEALARVMGLPYKRFSPPVRLECLMQDLPLCLPSYQQDQSVQLPPELLSSQIHGNMTQLAKLDPVSVKMQLRSPRISVIQFPSWFSFSPVKNAIHAGYTKLQNNSAAESIITGEFDLILWAQRVLLLLQLLVIPSSRSIFQTTQPSHGKNTSSIYEETTELCHHYIPTGPYILFKPRFATSIHEILTKIQPNAITATQKSLLTLNGLNLTIKRLNLDGFLIVHVIGSGKVTIDLPNVTIENQSASFSALNSHDCLRTAPSRSDTTLSCHASHIPLFQSQLPWHNQDQIKLSDDLVACDCHDPSMQVRGYTLLGADYAQTALNCLERAITHPGLSQQRGNLGHTSSPRENHDSIHKCWHRAYNASLTQSLTKHSSFCDIMIIDAREAGDHIVISEENYLQFLFPLSPLNRPQSAVSSML